MTEATPPLENLLSLARTEGVGLWAQDGGVHYRSPGPISAALREAIVANRAALLVRLAEWDGAEAIKLMHETDGAVASSGVHVLDEAIQYEAARCAEFASRADMTSVRSACALIENRVRQLAGERKGAA